MPCPCGNGGSHNEVDGPIAAMQLFRQRTGCIVIRRRRPRSNFGYFEIEWYLPVPLFDFS